MLERKKKKEGSGREQDQKAKKKKETMKIDQDSAYARGLYPYARNHKPTSANFENKLKIRWSRL
ncbi:hypothetical protein N7501_003686 [Penicillium viridicatum]|nr:hypothetical protein N7501_003686 [Penicillium viridicatum]